ncbi:MAG: excinuclease ABC subunit UvrA [Candidatus Woesearchaeota archaeon]|jgi:excinuclease ABC subunit A
MDEFITIKGAREHNLKNISLKIPRDKFVVITGLSGSGKSTLAFDTIYAEGQRRYVESLSAYARQFLGVMDKPDVDSIEGLSPAISIEQKSTSKNPRSTVGTVTEIYDYLRLLFARIGVSHCPKCGKPIKKQTPEVITDKILEQFLNKKIQIMSPIIRQMKGTYEQLIKDLKEEGFARVYVNGEVYNTDDKIPLDRYKKHDIYVVIDRISPTKEDRGRLNDAIEQAIKKSGGFVIILDEKNKQTMFSSNNACSDCDINLEEIQPRMFSFNSPFGACEDCHGLGIKQEFDPDLIIPDKTKAIADGAIAVYKGVEEGWRLQKIGVVAKEHGFDLFTPINKLKKSQLDILLYGSEKEFNFKFTSKDKSSEYKFQGNYEGVIPEQERLYKQTESDYRRQELEKFQTVRQCPKCKGKRLKAVILAVKIIDKSIVDVCDMSIKQSFVFFKTLMDKLSDKDKMISKNVLKEIIDRLNFLNNVGLNYLNLSRAAGTLSGGESQRIRLATQIGSNLVGVLYVLDEPSIGLHQKDNDKLIETLHKLRDLGNTLIVVEHDEDTIRNADYVVDIGPGAGVHGGHIVALGTPKEIEKNKNSITGQYLAKTKQIAVPKTRRKPDGEIKILGAKENNLKNINVSIPCGVLTCITGVSGSGKSSLVNSILHKALMKKLFDSKETPGKHDKLEISKPVDRVIIIDQSPIGRTPRSNPATYTKLFDDIRKLFASTKEAQLRGYKEGRFSFNVKGGRCENCQGDGLIKIEMNFLPDVYIQCEECKGKRYNKETLEVLYKGKNIADVLSMTCEEAFTFFTNHPSIVRNLETLNDVGLGYIKLGQSSTTLSGGESQRIKLTRELAKRTFGHTVYILDEPTTGLHFDDVQKLLNVLNRLTDKGSTIIVIEHNLDVIKCADWIIDLGPEGGDAGGEITGQGTPEEIAKNKNSYTGQYLKKVL